MIKKQVMNRLLESGLLKPYYVVEHSYTDNGKRTLQNLIVSTNGLFPCMTTRPDCLGVVQMKPKDNEYVGVYDYKESDTFRPTLEKRIHKNYPVSKTLTTRKDSCAVMLKTNGGGLSNLRIRKLVPIETMKLMGFERKDEQAMREIGMSDAAIYHCSGDSIVTTCLMALFGQMLPISENELQQKIESYVENIVEN